LANSLFGFRAPILTPYDLGIFHDIFHGPRQASSFLGKPFAFFQQTPNHYPTNFFTRKRLTINLGILPRRPRAKAKTILSHLSYFQTGEMPPLQHLQPLCLEHGPPLSLAQYLHRVLQQEILYAALVIRVDPRSGDSSGQLPAFDRCHQADNQDEKYKRKFFDYGSINLVGEF
jgi:hypothetical protein